MQMSSVQRHHTQNGNVSNIIAVFTKVLLLFLFTIIWLQTLALNYKQKGSIKTSNRIQCKNYNAEKTLLISTSMWVLIEACSASMCTTLVVKRKPHHQQTTNRQQHFMTTTIRQCIPARLTKETTDETTAFSFKI